jgi:hypothetical protein
MATAIKINTEFLRILNPPFFPDHRWTQQLLLELHVRTFYNHTAFHASISEQRPRRVPLALFAKCGFSLRLPRSLFDTCFITYIRKMPIRR